MNCTTCPGALLTPLEPARLLASKANGRLNHPPSRTCAPAETHPAGGWLDPHWGRRRGRALEPTALPPAHRDERSQRTTPLSRLDGHPRRDRRLGGPPTFRGGTDETPGRPPTRGRDCAAASPPTAGRPRGATGRRLGQCCPSPGHTTLYGLALAVPRDAEAPRRRAPSTPQCSQMPGQIMTRLPMVCNNKVK